MYGFSYRCMVFPTVYDIPYVYDFTRETPTVTRPYRALAGPGIAGLRRRRRPRTKPAGGRDRDGRGMIRSRGGGVPGNRCLTRYTFRQLKILDTSRET